MMIRDHGLTLHRLTPGLNLRALPFTLGENQVHLYSQIEGAVVSGKQLTNAVDFLQQQYGYASAYVPKGRNQAQ